VECYAHADAAMSSLKSTLQLQLISIFIFVLSKEFSCLNPQLLLAHTGVPSFPVFVPCAEALVRSAAKEAARQESFQGGFCFAVRYCVPQGAGYSRRKDKCSI
jgi:hypothetical protein